MEQVFIWIQQNSVEIMQILVNIWLILQVIFGRKLPKTTEQVQAKRQAKLQQLLKKAQAIQAQAEQLMDNNKAVTENNKAVTENE